MSVLNQSGEEQVECPLCMEPLEVDDLNFFPCTCGYQICRFCWHRIRTDENGLCPACRKAYPENPADFKPLTQEEVARLKAEKRHKDQQRKQKITENRKHLANVRVVQRNLVFVVGLPMRLADSEVLKKHEYFGKFGKIHKVVINQSTSYAGSQGPSASAYVTYHKADDALRAIQAVNNIPVDGRTMKTSLGTTKYCSHFMKNQACPKPDCMYLHDLGDMEASFTKEEMQQGKHQEYEKKLHDQLLNTYKDRKPTSSPPVVTPSAANCQNMGQPVTGCNGANNSNGGSSSCTQGSQSCNKEAWPSLQPGMPSAGGSTLSNLVPSTNGCSTGTKNETGFRKQSSSKNTNNHKKRHTSGEESRGKNKDKVHVPTDEQHKPSAGSSNKVGSGRGATNNSFSSDGTGLTDSSEPECPETEAGGRLRRAATLFEPDNNSFFSSNSFTKVAATAAGSASTEWPPNGLALAHMPDVLPPVHSSEDWQAAFGFSTSERPDAAPCNDGHQILNSHSSPPTTQEPQQEQPPGNNPLYRHHPRLQHTAYNGCSDGDEFAGYNGDTEGDDLGFDPFHETQKALAEMMETENEHRTNSHHHHGHHHHHSHHNHHNHHSGATVHSKLLSTLQHNQQHILAQQHPRRLPPNVSGCTKLLDGLGIGPTNNSSLGPSTPARTRLPPPGFTTAPNHMNAFGLGIPRAPSNTGSKILPLINPSAANGDTTPTSGHPQQPMLFPPPGSTNHLSSHSYGGAMHNGGSALGKEWPENLRSLLSNGQAFPGPNTPSQNSVFQSNTQKGWSPVGPCSDWTALDPAIVSSSRPHSFHPSQHNPLLLHGGSHPPQHWLRSLSDEGCLLYGGPMVHANNSSDWGIQSHNNPSSAPPPGFSVRGKPSPAPEMAPVESKPWSAGFAPIMNRDLVADL